MLNSKKVYYNNRYYKKEEYLKRGGRIRKEAIKK